MRTKSYKTNIITKIASVLLLMLLVIGAMPFFDISAASAASEGISLETTLTDNIVQRGSKKTFDVFARNGDGKKIDAIVKFNGKALDPTWDDSEKASYTLNFVNEGENIVSVSATDKGQKKELTYKLNYKKAKNGEKIGEAIWSIEAFTIGCGYIVYPVSVPIYEGETAAEQLVRLICENGYTCYYGGTVKEAFYIAYIANGNAHPSKYNGYVKGLVPKSPIELKLSPDIPDMLCPYLESTMTFFDPDDYVQNWKGYLGEFVFTNGSGWMYSVNNIFPNVGFADSYLSDGDVVRVQYTLGYGADIGGFGATSGSDIPNVENKPSGGYYLTSNKDELSRSIAKARASGSLDCSNVKTAYESSLDVMYKLNASQSEVDNAKKALDSALALPDSGNISFIDKNNSPSDKTTGTISSIVQTPSDTSIGADDHSKDSQSALPKDPDDSKDISKDDQDKIDNAGKTDAEQTHFSNDAKDTVDQTASPGDGNKGDKDNIGEISGNEDASPDNADSTLSPNIAADGKESGNDDSQNDAGSETEFPSSDESSSQGGKLSSGIKMLLIIFVVFVICLLDIGFAAYKRYKNEGIDPKAGADLTADSESPKVDSTSQAADTLSPRSGTDTEPDSPSQKFDTPSPKPDSKADDSADIQNDNDK